MLRFCFSNSAAVYSSMSSQVWFLPCFFSQTSLCLISDDMFSADFATVSSASVLPEARRWFYLRNLTITDSVFWNGYMIRSTMFWEISLIFSTHSHVKLLVYVVLRKLIIVWMGGNFQQLQRHMRMAVRKAEKPEKSTLEVPRFARVRTAIAKRRNISS